MARKPPIKRTENPIVKPTGRPLKEFDKKLFENLCYIWCTWAEIENILEANRETIAKWCQRTYNEPFSTVYNRFSDGGKASLRRNQLNLSKTNAAMAIWLGKQKLGQREDPQGNDSFNGELKEFIMFLKHKYGDRKPDEPVDKPKEIHKNDPNKMFKISQIAQGE